MLTIAFTGGGTGGHIYPALAVASALKEILAGEVRFFWIGSSAGMDRSLVNGAGIEFYGIPSGKLRRYFSLRTIPDFFKVIVGFFAAIKIFKRERPALLFSKGGYVSVTPCAAAAFSGIRVFTHESDFSPGLATRINVRFVQKSGGAFFAAYNETLSYFPKFKNRVFVCGNPVRSAFKNANPQAGRLFLGVTPDERILLVLGGSQGAQEINEMIRSILDELTKHFVVVHQTGQSQSFPATERYKPYKYIGVEMPDVMAAATLIMGRSGAGTVWESAVLGKPMLLLPLRGSGTRGDQIENARYFRDAGAAIVPEDVNAEKLAHAAIELANDDAALNAMAAASKKIGGLDGAQIIARVLAEETG